MGIFGKKTRNDWKKLESDELDLLLTKITEIETDVATIAVDLKSIESLGRQMKSEVGTMKGALTTLQTSSKPTKVNSAAKIVEQSRNVLLPIVAKLRSNLQVIDQFSRTLVDIEKHLVDVSFQVRAAYAPHGRTSAGTSFSKTSTWDHVRTDQNVQFAGYTLTFVGGNVQLHSTTDLLFIQKGYSKNFDRLENGKTFPIEIGVGYTVYGWFKRAPRYILEIRDSAEVFFTVSKEE